MAVMIFPTVAPALQSLPEETYQLYMDVMTLWELLRDIDQDSLRAAKIAEALKQFAKDVDFEQDEEARIADYCKAREHLKEVLSKTNGSTKAVVWAVGNAHLDLAWLWPVAETKRKTERTFAAQLRLLEEYPDYYYIQSQPAAYEICRMYYPDLFEKIKEAIKEGRWIAVGARGWTAKFSGCRIPLDIQPPCRRFWQDAMCRIW